MKKINRIFITTIILIVIFSSSVFATVLFDKLYITDSEFCESDNENVVYVTGDKIKAISSGTATVTYTDGDFYNIIVEGEDTEKKNYVNFLISLSNKVKNYSDEEKIKEIFRYAMNNGFVTTSSGGSKYEIVNNKPGDCAACAGLLKDIVRRCNIECNIIGKSNGHAYNEIYVNGKRYEVDLNLFLNMTSYSQRQNYINNLFK